MTHQGILLLNPHGCHPVIIPWMPLVISSKITISNKCNKSTGKDDADWLQQIVVQKAWKLKPPSCKALEKMICEHPGSWQWCCGWFFFKKPPLKMTWFSQLVHDSWIRNHFRALKSDSCLIGESPNVGKTIINHPSNHFFVDDTNHSQMGVYGIVLPTLQMRHLLLSYLHS